MGIFRFQHNIKISGWGSRKIVLLEVLPFGRWCETRAFWRRPVCLLTEERCIQPTEPSLHSETRWWEYHTVERSELEIFLRWEGSRRENDGRRLWKTAKAGLCRCFVFQNDDDTTIPFPPGEELPAEGQSEHYSLASTKCWTECLAELC